MHSLLLLLRLPRLRLLLLQEKVLRRLRAGATCEEAERWRGVLQEGVRLCRAAFVSLGCPGM